MKTLWAKISLIWKGRAIAEQLMNLKSRWKEPTFWLSLLTNAASAIASIKGILPEQYAPAVIVLNALVTAGYNYVRGLQKAQTDGVAPYTTSSEFWMGLATMANNALIDIHTGGVSTTYVMGSSILLGHAIAAARDLANMRPKEVAAATGQTVSAVKADNVG